MEQISNNPEDRKTYYQDANLLEESAGDPLLLNRLVALKIANDNLAAADLDSPDDLERAKKLADVMQEVVDDRKAQLGITPKDTSGAPE